MFMLMCLCVILVI